MAHRSSFPLKRTSADMLREVLSDRIVHGILQPGEALDETSLALEFGVSRTPIREALRQLETIGLAASRPHRGAVVANLTAEELDEAFVVMAELEALCARLCAASMTPAEKEALAALHEAGAVPVAENDVEGFRAHNERFHNAIYRGSGNGFLEEVTLGVRRRLAPFRKLQFETDRRIEGSQAEHARIVRAILEGDGETSKAAMRDHILIVRHKVGEAASGSHPDPDSDAH
jgi:DNA-binding GntR family transcriptional regulator